MYTADDARRGRQTNWDARIRDAAENNRCGVNCATIRVYAEDGEHRVIRRELEARGFKNVDVPSMMIKGDVYFEWDE